MHLNLDDTITTARLTSATGNVSANSPSLTGPMTDKARCWLINVVAVATAMQVRAVRVAVFDVVVVPHEDAHHIAALGHRGEHAGVQRPGAFILGGTADMRIVGVPPCSDVLGQGDMEKRQRRQRLPAVGRGIGGAAGAVPAHLLLREPAVAVDRRDC